MVAGVTAEVRLHGKVVGVLTYDRGSSRLTYTDDLQGPDHRVLGQIFEEDPRTVRHARTGLPDWLANLLPEGEFRRQVIREMGGGNIGDFRLLLRLGHDLPGAVTVHGEAEQGLDESEDLTARDEDPGPDALRYSLAGYQLKFSLRGDRLTAPMRNRDGWVIAKLPDRALNRLAENEYLTMRWLALAGFDVPPVDLVRAETLPTVPPGFLDPEAMAYVIERFDRSPAGPVHVEDFAQVANVGPRQKYGESGATYDTVGGVIRLLAGESDFEAYVDRLVAMIVTGNTDGHLKNWALWYPDGVMPRLAPVYDFHSLSVYQRFRYQPLALSLAGEQMPEYLNVDHFRRLAEFVGADPDRIGQRVAHTVARLREVWEQDAHMETKRFFPGLADHYERRLRTLPLAQG
ncbi:type II toxin-antitoxin system HipA family toxin [Catenuloplanes nepalensis]|uniref:type II toxin-antitoxin system HipA family toxin n=1 Tax=Catenuloplanes nepalensis TaxID=587533 RepID=UPI0027D7A43F|nr:HipA domain-containing protein [Catenuloplanes nepalensis]